MSASTQSITVGANAGEHACTSCQNMRACHHATIHRYRDSYAPSQSDVAATNSSLQWEINILVAFGWTTTKRTGRYCRP